MRSEPNFVMAPDDGPLAGVDQLRRQALRLLQHGDEQQAGDANGRVAPPHAEAPRAARTRAVMISAITMPAVFLVVVMGALALFGKPAAEKSKRIAANEMLMQPAPATGVTMASARSSRPAAISLGEDTRIADISLDGDRVALHVESPMGQEILIYDFAKGRIIAEAPIETASLDAVDTLAMLTGAPQPPAKIAPAVVSPPAPMPAEPQAPPTTPSVKPRSSD